MLNLKEKLEKRIKNYEGAACKFVVVRDIDSIYVFQLLEAIVPGEETAINRTCVAALFSEKASVTGITESEKKKMKKAMKDAPVHYRHQLDQNLNRNARSLRRCLIRSMFYYLHSSRVKATDLQIPVSDKRLKKVESFSQQFRRDLLGDCPMRDKALFYSALGDLFAWKGQYEEGLYCVAILVFMAAKQMYLTTYIVCSGFLGNEKNI